MLRRIYFRFRYGSYLRSDHGIKKFAEMAVGQLILRVTKKGAFYREMNENLLVEKANLRLRAEELYEQPMLSPGEYFSVRRRVWANGFIVSAAIVASIFLVFVSLTAILGGGAAVDPILQWSVSVVLAVIVTGGGLIVTERLIGSLIPGRSPSRWETDDAGRAVVLLWIFLLTGIQLSILGISEIRASELAALHGSWILYVGYVALTMFLPIVAGAIRWDAMRFVDAYKTTRSHREIDSRLAQIDSILRQNEEYESNFYKLRSVECWDVINEFRTFKDLYNERTGMVEHLTGHFAQSYDTFQREAFRRYESDLRDFQTTSMRRIDTHHERKMGRKIGQISTDRMPGVPASSPRTKAHDGAPTVPESDIYLAPKPVR